MEEKPLYWLGSSHDDLMSMPEEVKDVFGYALDLAQNGLRHPKTKPFKIHGEPGIIEIMETYDGNAYRAIYTIRHENAVYVIHCFQKKSTSGIKTPQKEIDLVIERLKRLKIMLSREQQNG